MRKSIKQQLLELLGSVHEALKLAKNSKNINILAECQDATDIIASSVVEADGEESPIIELLVKFNEALFKASIAIENEKDFSKLINTCRDKLKKIEYEIKKLPITYEILFVPYKSSMWDAFDSVYREAKKAKNCNVTVVAAPYYNVNPQGQVLGVEYEGENFPEDVVITHYDSYSIPNMKPDVIFIHNPYDQFNRVTRLHESFFSSELIKHTEKLVYIPYFITDGTQIKASYTIQPGPQNAWRTFVQSDAVREDYCKYNSPEKIIALGSPKFDMVVKYDKEKPAIPEDWEATFKNKKVFFYNTHLRNVIADAEKAIEKIGWVFSQFENRDDIALLWRPHPLSIQTAKSMNPNILNKYMALIDRFKNLSNGVYDDTEDLHRAIAISDAYIGDFSSVLYLYRLTGKPIYLTLNSNIPVDIFDYLTSEAGASINDEIYAFSDEFNGLFKIKNNKAGFVCKFEKEPDFLRNMFSVAKIYNDDIIFLPTLSKYIVRFNTKTNDTHYFEIKNTTTNQGVVSGAYIWNDILYAPISRKSELVKINLKNNSLKIFKSDFEKEINLKNITFAASKQKEHLIFIACANAPKFIIWNMNDDTYSVVDVPIAAKGFMDIAISEDNRFYFLTEDSNDIYEWNIDKNDIKCILNDSGASRIHFYNQKLFLIPGSAEKFRFIDTNSYKLTTLDYPEGFEFLNTYKISGPKYNYYEVENNHLQLFPKNANMYLEIDMDTCEINGSTWQLPEECTTDEFKNAHRINYDYTYFDGRISLEQFIDNIDKDPYKEERKQVLIQNNNISGSAGKKIWDYVYKFL